jgi:hypothetical protein
MNAQVLHNPIRRTRRKHARVLRIEKNHGVAHVNSERRHTNEGFGSSKRWRLSQLFSIDAIDMGAEDDQWRVVPLTVRHPKSLFRLRSIATWVIGISTGQYAAQ